MGASEETLALLKSIDASLKALVQQSRGPVQKLVADDRDLDGQYGDPVLKFTPKDWTGDSYKDRKFSECPAPLLDTVADSLDYFAKKADEKGEKTSSGKDVAPFKRLDAARARGWAARIRAGRVPAAVGEVDTSSDWPEPGF